MERVAFMVIFVVLLTGCGQSVEVKLETQSLTKPDTTVSADPLWKKHALDHRLEAAHVIVSTPTESRTEDGKSCPAKTVCIRAPYLGVEQFRTLTTVVAAHPRFGPYFSVTTEAENDRARVALNLTGTCESGVLRYFFEADVIDIQDDLVIRSDGRDVMIVASEIQGGGQIDTTPMAVSGMESAKAGGTLTVFAATASVSRLSANGQEGKAGVDAALSLSDDIFRSRPIPMRWALLHSQYNVAVQEAVKFWRLENEIPLSDLSRRFQFSPADILAEQKAETLIVAITGTEKIPVREVLASELMDNASIIDGSNGFQGGPGGVVEVYTITGTPLATAKGGKGGTGGLSISNWMAKQLPESVKILTSDRYAFSCYRLGCGKLESKPKMWVTLEAPISCKLSTKKVSREITVKLTGKADRSLGRNGLSGSSGKQGVVNVFSGSEKGNFLATLQARMHWAQAPIACR